MWRSVGAALFDIHVTCDEFTFANKDVRKRISGLDNWCAAEWRGRLRASVLSRVPDYLHLGKCLKSAVVAVFYGCAALLWLSMSSRKASLQVRPVRGTVGQFTDPPRTTKFGKETFKFVSDGSTFLKRANRSLLTCTADREIPSTLTAREEIHWMIVCIDMKLNRS